MAETYTHYKILLSCPSDCENKKKVVEESIKTLNETVGATEHLKLELKYWKNDAYPQTGSSGQDIINRQLVDNCDAVIAIFWTKFGSPTDKYGSGTEEEIERMIQQKKQMFLYFCEEAVTLTSINSIEIEKIKNFKKKYESEGLYKTFKSDEELKDMLKKDILDWITRKIKNKSFALVLKGINAGKLDTILHVQNIKCRYNIQTLFSKIKKMYFDVSQINLGVPSNSYSIISGKPIHIDNKTKIKIGDFAENNNIEMAYYNFFNLGHLVKTSMCGTSFDILDGTNGEKEKYENILALAKMIDEYLDYTKFETFCSSIVLLPTAIQNNDVQDVTNIGITLEIEKNDCFDLNSFYIPETDSGNKFFIKEKIYEKTFCIKNPAECLSYPVITSIPFYSEIIRECNEILNSVFSYKILKDSTDISSIKLNIDKLGNSITMILPIILLKKKESYKPIKYRINAANMEKDIVGEIQICE